MTEVNVMTASIDLMDQNNDQQQFINNESNDSKTHDLRDDSLMDPPNWQHFIGSNRHDQSTSLDKKVFQNSNDDDEVNSIKLESKSPGNTMSDDGQLYTEGRGTSSNKNGGFNGFINEQLDHQSYEDDNHSVHENVSVFSDDDPQSDRIEHRSIIEDLELEQHVSDPDDADEDQIPFNIHEDHEAPVVQEGISQEDMAPQTDTLGQMRMMFGSEQIIREQSEQAIKQFNTDISGPIEPQQEEAEPLDDHLNTPGKLNQSLHESQRDLSNSNVFDRKSFQDFSMKKFQELMFENKMGDFMSSVERTVRQNTKEEKLSESGMRYKNRHSQTPKRGSYVSPRKSSRKELELDLMVGSKMKYMSEKKRQRNSMLDQNSESVILQNSDLNLVNQSLDLHKLDTKDKKSFELAKEISLSDTKIQKQASSIQYIKNMQPAMQTEVNDKLHHEASNELNSSMKRSDVRGLENMISEKNSNSPLTHSSHTHKQDNTSEDAKTLVYGTAERSQADSISNPHIQSQKDEMYTQLNKIMGNCLVNKDNQKPENQPVKDVLDIMKTQNSEHTASLKDIISPLSSNLSHQNSESRVINAQDLNNPLENQKTGEIMITPRIHESDTNTYSYKTPTSDLIRETTQNSQNLANFQTIGSYESDRREDVYNTQFYSNTNNDRQTDDNIRICVDQWDAKSEKEYEEISSSDPYNPNESIGIHTAKNSPLISAQKNDEIEAPSSEKYTITEESAEKHLSDLKNQKGASFEYKKAKLGNVKRNLQSTLQDNISNCLNSPNNDDFILSNSNVSQELKLNRMPLVDAEKANNGSSNIYVDGDHDGIPDYLKLVTPRDTASSPSNFDESKCIVLSNQKVKSIDDSVDAIDVTTLTQVQQQQQQHRNNDIEQKTDYLTEEILSMMFYSDIHDNPMVPHRSKTMVDEMKHKYPFNKPLGINTAEEGVEGFVNQLVDHINHHYIDSVINKIQQPICVNPEFELARLQFYEESSPYKPDAAKYEDILPNEIFYTLEQRRRDLYACDDNSMISPKELEMKIHNTFIHDKMLFDSFNAALHSHSKRKQEV